MSTRSFPVLTPLAFDSSHPFPFISNLSLNLAIIVRDQNRKEFFARVKVPTNLFSRLIRVPEPDGGTRSDDSVVHFVYLEEIIAAHLDLLFPGLEVVASFPFRITRDADLEIEVDEASDLLTTVEEIMEQRARGKPVRIEVDCSMHDGICHMLEKKLGVTESMLYRVGHPVGMADLMQLMSLDRPDLKDAPFLPSVPADLAEDRDIFAAIRRHDILLYQPYDSFTPVVNFIRQAAHDPDVLAIKITLYRVGSNSPIVNALMEARENGKAVAALIELKARFDEENNIGWARALERAGRPRGVRRRRAQGPRQALHGCPARKGRDPALHAPRDRQLQCDHEPDLHRLRPLHLRQGDRRGYCEPLQFPDRLCPDRAVQQAARRPGHPAERHPGEDRTGDRPPAANMATATSSSR